MKVFGLFPLTLVLLLLVLLGLAWATSSHAQTLDLRKDGVRTVATVAVNSSTVGVTVCDYIDNECSVQVPATAGVRVCLAPVNAGTACSAGFTTPGGRCLAANEGWTYLPREDGWIGQICGLLESGATPISVQVIRR